MKHLSPAEIETIRIPEPKHDPFSLESLVAWLERQPADGVYDWEDIRNCLCAQYFGHRGWADDHEKFQLATGVRLDSIACHGDWTFGAALTRAHAALSSQKGNANG